MSLDLFGNIVVERDPPPPGEKKRRETRPNGYAAPPGGGPKGETCKSCTHYARVRHSNIYRKCLLVRASWTNGPGTDILAKSPACVYWKKPEEVACP